MEDTIDRHQPPQQTTSEPDDIKRSLDHVNLSQKDKDRAKELVERVGHRVELTPENNRRICRKIDLRVLPVILFIYFLQALDSEFPSKLESDQKSLSSPF